MKNDMATDTTTWTLGELCDYWRANLARLQASMDFRTLGALQEALNANAAVLKLGSDNLWMPINAHAEKAPVPVPSWIPKPDGKRGLPEGFRRVARLFGRLGPELRGLEAEFAAIAAEFESTGTNPFEQKGLFSAPQAAFAFPQFDLGKVLMLLAKFGPLLARIDDIKKMPQGKERIAATTKLIADIAAAVAEMLGAGTTVKGPFGAARRGRKAGKR